MNFSNFSDKNNKKNNNMKDFGKYIMEKSREYSDDVQYQLAYRQGAEEAMKWINERTDSSIKELKEEG